jgi:hypothetical protein
VYHVAAVEDELICALNAFDWPKAESICKQIIEQASTMRYDEEAAKRILSALRRKRRFDLMSLVADAFIRGGQDAPQIFRQYAQSLIDQGMLTAARTTLAAALAELDPADTEWAELRGLLGRTYKQLYIENPNQPENLRQAIKYYYGVYQKDPESYLWQGINTVACLARAERDNIPPPADIPPALTIAQEIDAALKQVKELKYWARATAIEVAVAVGNTSDAFYHAFHYTNDDNVDAFEITSLLRQLREVWQLTTDAEPGKLLLPVLESALLKRQGGCLTVSLENVGSDAKNAGDVEKRFERVFGQQRFQSLPWYKTGLKRCEAVGRVESLAGRKVGTGFLVRASDFLPGRSEKELLFLTNAHVIPEDLAFKSGKVVFEAVGQTYRILELVWSSPSKMLDATFLRLDGVSEQAELCPLEPDPAPFDAAKEPRVYVIGYPLGGELSFSLQDSVWVSTDGNVLRYRTPTESGSSGSPVFDQEFWTVVGLHHAALKNENEAIAIRAIQEEIRRANSFKAAEAPDQAQNP